MCYSIQKRRKKKPHTHRNTKVSEQVNHLPRSCPSMHQTCVESHLCVPGRLDKRERDRFHWLKNVRQTESSSSVFYLSHSEHSDLLLSLCCSLLQLGFGLLQLALQSVAGRLQVADLGFALLQRQGQLCHLTFNLQLLLLVLQADL